MLFMAFLSKTLVIVQWLNGAEKKLKYINLFPGLIKTNERIVLVLTGTFPKCGEKKYFYRSKCKVCRKQTLKENSYEGVKGNYHIIN